MIERRIEAPTNRRRAPRGGRRASDPPGKHPTLLIAESYAGSRRVCVRYLDHFGFRVEEAGDGIEAMAKIEADLPQAILIEHSLPAMPAAHMSNWLEQQPETHGIPLIVMTTDFDNGARDAVLRGANVLVKPFSLSAMLETIRQVLRAHVST